MSVAALLLAILATAGIGYTLFAALLVRGFTRTPDPLPVTAEPVTLLKPLHGAEPRLAENLATFLDQHWDAPVEMVCGVQRADDPARVAIARLDRSDRRRIVEILDAARHGANAKVSNLINMAPAASHDLIVLSDSDMVAPPDYFARLAAALAIPGTGAVTRAYVGRGDAGRWSRLAAGGIGYHFIPQLLIGLRTGLARPGMGSTIALRRETLDRIGGFRPFADALADDYALGEAVRGLGLTVAVPPMLLVHGCAERALSEVWRHELRWAATILRINPGGQIGTIVTYPLPLALAVAILSPLPGASLILLALGARLLLKRQVDRAAGFSAMPAWALPLRDCLSFAVFVGAFFARSVDWRGASLKMEQRGRIVAQPESTTR